MTVPVTVADEFEILRARCSLGMAAINRELTAEPSIESVAEATADAIANILIAHARALQLLRIEPTEQEAREVVDRALLYAWGVEGEARSLPADGPIVPGRVNG